MPHEKFPLQTEQPPSPRKREINNAQKQNVTEISDRTMIAGRLKMVSSHTIWL